MQRVTKCKDNDCGHLTQDRHHWVTVISFDAVDVRAHVFKSEDAFQMLVTVRQLEKSGCLVMIICEKCAPCYDADGMKRLTQDIKKSLRVE